MVKENHSVMQTLGPTHNDSSVYTAHFLLATGMTLLYINIYQENEYPDV